MNEEPIAAQRPQQNRSSSVSRTRWAVILPRGATLEQLEGTVERVIVSQADGYGVVALRRESELLPVTVVGVLGEVCEGEQLLVKGRWVEHPRFGRQFRVAEFQASLPQNEAGLLRYLGSGAISGIGPAMAQRLVDAFGPNLFDLAESDPLILMQVPGIGEKRAKTLAKALASQRQEREAMVFLQGVGLGPATANRVYRFYQETAIETVKSDPYRLVSDVEGIGFLTADGIAKKLGVTHDSPSRVAAGTLHLLEQARENGDTVCERQLLIERVAQFLAVDELRVKQELDALERRGRLRSCEMVDGTMVGNRRLVDAERRIAKRVQDATRLSDLLAATTGSERGDSAGGIELSDEQRAAVRLATTKPLVVITGGPGTGKTTVVRSLVAALQQSGKRIRLCAPTGRAAKRLSEASGVAASTVHRLLGFRGKTFEHNADNPLQVDTVILDEASMLDVPLAAKLLDALPRTGQLVLVGDADQLPSVGPGNVLRDLIASQNVPVARLTQIFRQAQQSRIVLNAHRIRDGELPEPSVAGAKSGGDFHQVLVNDTQRAQQRLLEVCCDRIPKAFGLDPARDVQVLSPMHRGDVGTVALNVALQGALNPAGPAIKRPHDVLRVGDKVMQIKNDHDRDVFNGDLGWILQVDAEKQQAVVEINGNHVDYSATQLGQLALAYCISIHKSQGSEYPAVVIPLMTQHYMLLQRNLLYTAVTRARELVVLVGSQKALRMAVGRVDTSRRKTLLAELLCSDI
jgi:exodeoxyribonuclease V alpha subunit